MSKKTALNVGLFFYTNSNQVEIYKGIGRTQQQKAFMGWVGYVARVFAA